MYGERNTRQKLLPIYCDHHLGSKLTSTIIKQREAFPELCKLSDSGVIELKGLRSCKVASLLNSNSVVMFSVMRKQNRNHQIIFPQNNVLVF